MLDSKLLFELYVMILGRLMWNSMAGTIVGWLMWKSMAGMIVGWLM
jgi:hypothetical protein